MIYGDIMPSNILPNGDFNAKIGDFRLAQLKSEPHLDVLDDGGDEEVINDGETSREGEEGKGMGVWGRY